MDPETPTATTLPAAAKKRSLPPAGLFPAPVPALRPGRRGGRPHRDHAAHRAALAGRPSALRRALRRPRRATHFDDGGRPHPARRLRRATADPLSRQRGCLGRAPQRPASHVRDEPPRPRAAPRRGPCRTPRARRASTRLRKSHARTDRRPGGAKAPKPILKMSPFMRQARNPTGRRFHRPIKDLGLAEISPKSSKMGFVFVAIHATPASPPPPPSC
jgi:hypothetical protein